MTTAQKIQYQRATLIARLQALDPTRGTWTLRDSYRELLDTFFYLTDRATARASS